MNRAINIAVVGAGVADAKTASTAFEVGREIALQKWVLICGGLGGVMEAASKGAFENGGTTVGLLPGYGHTEANKFIRIVIPTGLGHARNAVVAASADGIIAVGGEYGTLSEIALGLKMGKPVVGIETFHNVKGIMEAKSASEAIDIIKRCLA